MKISPSLINSALKSFSDVKTFLEIGRRTHFTPKFKPKFTQKPVYKSQEKRTVHEFLINSLQKCKSVEEQIKVFHSLIKLPAESINCRHSICEELERILQPYFPSCFVRLIGSSVSGFGAKGCDVDLSIQFNDTNANEQDVESNMHLNEESGREIPDNKMSSSKKQLLNIRKILQNLKYEEPVTVIPGRCPILNFTRHNLSCDLAVNNSLALQSTNLMILCGRLDERIVPLTQIINYWAKHLKIVGGLDKFKTYAIFLMVVYFLQSRNPPILPSIEMMFEKTGLLKNLGNWSYDIIKYVNEFECSKNNQTVEELLKDFFFFYRSFDYSQIICPLSGSCMNRKTFAEKTKGNSGFQFQFNTISIQDPFEETWNVTSCVNWEHSRNFIKAVIAVTEKYQDQNCWIPVPYSWGLASFIDKDMKEFFMDIPVSSLTNSGYENNAIDPLEQAANKLEHILRYCLQAECYPLDKNIDFKSLDVPSDVKIFIENILKHENNNNLIKDNLVSSTDCSENYQFPNFVTQYICAISDTWSNRHAYISSFDQTKNIFENEREISRKILQDETAKEKELFYLLCKCYGVHYKGNTSLRVKIKPLEDSKFNVKLFLTFKKHVLKLMDFK